MPTRKQHRNPWRRDQKMFKCKYCGEKVKEEIRIGGFICCVRCEEFMKEKE